MFCSFFLAITGFKVKNDIDCKQQVKSLKGRRVLNTKIKKGRIKIALEMRRRFILSFNLPPSLVTCIYIHVKATHVCAFFEH